MSRLLSWTTALAVLPCGTISRRLIAFVLLLLFPCAAVCAAITVDTVPVGDVGNVNDPATGNHYGGVNYAYSIGKYEVTVAQYTVFLNAVAKTDPYYLYHPNWAAIQNFPIKRSGAPGSYTYAVIATPNNPMGGVDWVDAFRFANWLHNSQPTGAEDNSTTEDGAYTINGAASRSALAAVVRNANAMWFLPSESEWYKAAYYQPAEKGGDSDSYWAFPMRTNEIPYSDQPPGATPDNTRVGNFYKDDGVANGYDDGYAAFGRPFFWPDFSNPITDVGSYTSAAGYYGTYDQGGNVAEWTEGRIGDSRAIRGGGYVDRFEYLQASVRRSDANTTAPFAGFRVAAVVPEPSECLLCAFAALILFSSARVTERKWPNKKTPAARWRWPGSCMGLHVAKWHSNIARYRCWLSNIIRAIAPTNADRTDSTVTPLSEAGHTLAVWSPVSLVTQCPPPLRKSLGA